MGFFDFITDIFSKSDKGKPKKKKKGAKKKAVPAKKAKKKPSAKGKPVKKTAKAGAPPKKMGVSLKADTKGKKKKKRKKSKQVSADPINEQALGFSISLKGEDEQSKKRNAIRIKVDGLTVLVKRLGKEYPVTDISATGLGFDFEKPRIKGGVMLEMDLILNGTTKTTGLVGKVMRHERGSVGCIFQELDRAQDDAVHEVVLLGQKQQAARKAKQKDRDFQMPD